jgi:hypothetical protein
MKEIYERVAADFAEKIDHLFESEKSLETTFKQYYEGLPFDRTEHWSGIIHKILSDSFIIFWITIFLLKYFSISKDTPVCFI